MSESNPLLETLTASELAAGRRHIPLGTAALRSTAEVNTPDHAVLPNGFEFADAGSIGLSELASLFRTVDIGKETNEYELVRTHEDFQEDGYESIEIGVRDSNTNELVGYGGLIYDSDGNAEMGDFVVKPAYQSRGIGKAIIDERLAQADARGIATISIPALEATNTLKRYYEKRGFIEQGDILVRTAPKFVALAEEPTPAK